uniref:Uncharacterized protein n=1 Tax=Anopheles dirus TaxID=7168 RepID=A0A182N7E3_9DIPT
MECDSNEETSGSLNKMNEDLQRSRSPLETVTEEAEGAPPFLVTPKTDWESYPLLVEDSSRVRLAPTLDCTLRYFFTHCPKDVSEISRSDLMIVLIYVIALESGLIPKGVPMPAACLTEKYHSYRAFDKRLVKHFATRLPLDCFRNRASPYRLEMELVHQKAVRDNIDVSLVAYCSVDLLVVNLLWSANLTVCFSTVVPVSFYVPAINANRLPFCFQHLSRLSVKMKDELFVPFRSFAYSKYIPVICPSMAGLPQEVVKHITRCLDFRTRRNLLEVLKPSPPVIQKRTN